MVTKDDNILDGLTYEQSLFVVCEHDIDRFYECYERIMPLLNKIPLGWSDKQ